MREEPETIQVGMPKPRIIRATMYMATGGDGKLAFLPWYECAQARVFECFVGGGG